MSDNQDMVALINQVLDQRKTDGAEVKEVKQRRKRNLTDEQRAKLSENARNSAWNKFRKEYGEKNPDVRGKALMKAASEAYRAQKVTKADKEQA